ncbi:cardiolipin synthetase [Klebsiella pneumoniae]|uniref:Cardiolipin synthetase n=1 Tax=Klebsiella pneumoniae TaxID=573 RepID=A0A2X3CHF1_KLEPN|nr:cardiolipin synthetase [Klebsiella pneumoniae]
MTTFYTVVNWLVILGYWLLIAGVTLRILMKRRAVPSAMAWLLIIYILPLVGIIAYLSFGELHLGKRRAERARAMWPSTAKWLTTSKPANISSRKITARWPNPCSSCANGVRALAA